MSTNLIRNRIHNTNYILSHYIFSHHIHNTNYNVSTNLIRTPQKSIEKNIAHSMVYKLQPKWELKSYSSGWKQGIWKRLPRRRVAMVLMEETNSFWVKLKFPGGSGRENALGVDFGAEHVNQHPVSCTVRRQLYWNRHHPVGFSSAPAEKFGARRRGRQLARVRRLCQWCQLEGPDLEIVSICGQMRE